MSIPNLLGHDPAVWAQDLLTKCGFPITPSNVQAIVSWEYAESGGGGGRYNPLNTTLHWPGSQPIGGNAGQNAGDPVQDYATYQDGVAANAQALLEPQYYSAVIAALQAGDNAITVVDAVMASPWGTRQITLIGVGPIPAPAPVPSESGEHMLVASPHQPTVVGRSPAAVWDPNAPNQVYCTNGGSISGDQPFLGVRVWKPPISPGQKGIGIFPMLDGKGIVLQTDHQATFIGLWS